VRLKKDGKADVPLRNGQIFEQSIVIFERFGLRRLFFLILRRVQVIASTSKKPSQLIQA
jgi:hypothetical protein